MYIEYKIKTASKEEMVLHLKKCNDNFIPPLDQKVNLEEYAQKLADRSITFEAWINGELAGLIAAYLNDVEHYAGYITSVSVLSDHTGKGIATELLSQCIEYAGKQHFRQIELEVSGDNYGAIQLYKKFNFAPFENNNQMVRMKLILSK
jgi:ribosomal protein S18 acetylase RimI-like enzyme